MTTPYSETHGVRQLAVLATVAACIALMMLLIGAVMSGLASLHYGVALVLASLAFVGVALFGGWVPGLYLGLLTLVVGAIVAGDEYSWVQAIVLAITISGVHEASRFSLDARKPTRLGAGLLIRTSLSALPGAGVAIIAGVIVRPALTDDPSVYWVPAALAATALLLFAARFHETVSQRLSNPGGRIGKPIALAGSGLAAVGIVVVVAMGAQYRAASSDDGPALEPTTNVASTDLGQLAPEQLSSSLATLFGMFLAAAILGLLYGALNRRQLMLVQDDIEFDLDDSRFAFSLPDPAELDDAGLDIGRTANLIQGLLADLESEADPGRAIRFAYARVEAQLAEVDLAPAESETAHEFLRRALPALGDGAALGQLTSLFERARFSESPVTEGMRGDARETLTELRAQLEQLVDLRQQAAATESERR